MADEKAKIVTDATGPSSGPAPAQPEVDAQVSKQEQSAPEAPTPDKAEAPAQEAPAQDKAADAPKEQKAASVSVFNFSESWPRRRPRSGPPPSRRQRPRTKGLPLRRPRRTGRSRKSPKSKNRHRSAGADRPRPTSTRLPLPHRKKRPARRIRQYRNLHSREKRKRPLPPKRQRKPPRLPVPLIRNVCFRNFGFCSECFLIDLFFF